jgi:hypothetical protein
MFVLGEWTSRTLRVQSFLLSSLRPFNTLERSLIRWSVGYYPKDILTRITLLEKVMLTSHIYRKLSPLKFACKRELIDSESRVSLPLIKFLLDRLTHRTGTLTMAKGQRRRILQ